MNIKLCIATSGALLFTLTAASASAHGLQIYGGNNVEIADGSTIPSKLNETDFGQVQVGDGYWVDIWLTAKDNTPVYRTGNITVTGANPTDFQIFYPYGLDFPIENNGYFPLRITFAPGGTGLRTATVTFPTNIAGPQSQYSFAVQGEGINGFPLATTDLEVYDFANYPKSKQDKKTGQYKVSWKVTVTNVGPVASEGGVVNFYYSNDETLSAEDQLISTVPLKPLKAQVEGKKPKSKKVKFKGLLPTDDGWIFVVATSLPLFPSEENQENNIWYSSYYTPTK